MDINKIYELVCMACDDKIPKGVDFAWDRQNGEGLKWSDLREVLAQHVTFPSENVTPIVLDEQVPHVDS